MRIAVLGLGLIGGSLAQALHPAHDVVGFDVDSATREAAAAWGLRVDAGWQDVDLVVLAASVPVNNELLRTVPPHVLVTDVGSVKQPLVDCWNALSDRPALVPGHPMAGADTAGWDAARPDLFQDARWVLCPGEWSSAAQWLAVAELVLSLGAVVVPAHPEEHDDAAAAISHVPHIVASVLSAHASRPLARSLAANSFRDLTRVTGSPPARTAEFCFANRDSAAMVLREVREALDDVIHGFELGDADPLTHLLEAGHAARHDLDRSRVQTADGTVELRPDDRDWSAPLIEIASAGGVVVGVSGLVLNTRRPA